MGTNRVGKGEATTALGRWGISRARPQGTSEGHVRGAHPRAARPRLGPRFLGMALSQRCKEKGQIQCQDSCGWASCVPASDTYADNAYYDCCPFGYAFKCCAMLPKMKYSFVWKPMELSFRVMQEKCKDKSGLCVCQPLWTTMMNGLCCYANGGCGCCFNPDEPTIGKLPKVRTDLCVFMVIVFLLMLAYFPDRLDEKGGCGNGHSNCIWMEGVPETHCCPQNYQLAPADDRFVSEQSRTELVGRVSSITRKWVYQRVPQYAWVYEQHEYRKTCYQIKYDGWDKTEERSGGFGTSALTHHIPDKYECAGESYWMPHLLPDLTTVVPDDRKFTWMKKKTTEMVREMNSKSECKRSTVFCACNALHFDQMMNGMCCDKSTDCGCCRTDPTISKLPKLARDPVESHSCEDQIKEQIRLGQRTYCQWAEGWPASSCCATNYKLVIKDERYDEQEIPDKPLWDNPDFSSKLCSTLMKEQFGETAMCQWAEGSPATECCNKNYKLVAWDYSERKPSILYNKPCEEQIKEQVGEKPATCQWRSEVEPASSCCSRYFKLVAAGIRLRHGELPPYLSIKGISRRYPLCRDAVPSMYPTICALDWYWVPRAVWTK
ncbi:hypothetical protein GPALN_004181 [Globodera pallida]|nr:hypothetical protein GPALN_004181 [Globodera pallida]